MFSVLITLVFISQTVAFGPAAYRVMAKSRTSVPSRGSVRMEFGVVITGGSAGVGFAYADSFLKRGHSGNILLRLGLHLIKSRI